MLRLLVPPMAAQTRLPLHSVTETAGVPGAFSQRVLRFRGTPTVAVLYVLGPDIDAHVSAYEAAYRAAYAAFPKMLLLFDARHIGGLPSGSTIQRKLQLTADLKQQTTYKVPFVGVLVSNALFADVITRLLKARGQAAPLLLTHSEAELAQELVRAVYVADGWNPRSSCSSVADASAAPTLCSTGFVAVYVCTLLLYLKFMRHHVVRPPK